MRRRSALIALAAVAGPGVLAGLSDDDPPGITTYSILGADYGYELLWVLLLSTLALALFHEVGARIGIASGQGIAGLVRERYGVRHAALVVLALVVANVGTTCAELAGIAAGFELVGVTRYASVPIAAVGVSVLVLRGSFRRVEHVLLALSTAFAAYIAAALLSNPDWGAAARGLVVPELPLTQDALLVATATVGTTLAPWGLAFIQSYAVDKGLKREDFHYARIDVFVGAAMTGIIGACIVIACAATLHASGRSLADAADAAVALEPVAGGLAATLFGVGLVGAGLLAASILPLATAYSVSEALGDEAALDDSMREAPVFYATFALVMGVAVVLILVPGVSLVPVLFLSQALNALLLLPLLVAIRGIARDPAIMGDLASGRAGTLAQTTVIVALAACIVVLGILTVW